MPGIVAGLAIALSGGIGPATLAATVAASAIVGLVSSFALYAVSNILFKPKAPSFDQQGRKITFREATQPRRVIYGETRVGGTIVFMETTDRNSLLHLVIALAGHEVEQIGDVYFDEEVVPLNGAGEATGKYGGLVRVKKHLGTWDQPADADLIAATDKWTDNHRLRGIAYAYVRLRFNQDKFPTGVPNISFLVKGKKVWDPRDGNQSAGDYFSWTWSNNAALCAADYLRGCPVPDANGGMARLYGIGALDAEISEAHTIAAANACDETVDRITGGSEKRYTCNGVISTDIKPSEAMRALLTAMGGKAVVTGGLWRLYAATAQVATVTLTEDDLRGPYRVSAKVPARDRFNAVKGVFVSPENRYEAADFPAVTNAIYEEQDGGRRKYRDISLPFTDSSSMAQRLAKIELEKVRQEQTVELKCKLTAFRCLAGGVVLLTLPRVGYNAKLFDVVSWKMVPYEVEGVPAMGIDLVLRETAPEVYDWNSGEETIVDPAPDTDLPNPFDPDPPTELVLDSGSDQLLLGTDGSVISRILATWTASPDGMVAEYEVQFKRSAETEWTGGAVAVAGSARAYIAPVEDGVDYDVRVRSRNALGVRSDWITVSGHTVAGKTQAPPEPSSFTVVRTADGTRRASWTLDNPPADVRSGGGFHIRWKAGSTSDWDAMEPLHTGKLLSSPYDFNELAAGTYTFAIKTVDSSENESEIAVFRTVTIGDPRLRSILFQQLEHALGWPGTKTDCFVDEGILKAVSDGDWDDLASTWDALADTWDSLLPGVTPISYETGVIDLSADVSFTPLVSVISSATATVTMKTGTDADGTVTGSYATPAFADGVRYVQFRIEVGGSNPSISALIILLDGEGKTDEFEDVDTSSESAVWFERVGTGHFRVGSKSGQIATVTQATVVLQNVGPGWTASLISKAVTVNSQPGAEWKLYDGTGTLADAVVDLTLKGPKISA